MIALRFKRSVPRYAASRVAGRAAPGLVPQSLRCVSAHYDDPELPGDGWVRVAPKLSGICGSDLAMLAGDASFYFSPIVSMPFVPGHEIVGTLLDATRDEARRDRAGARVRRPRHRAAVRRMRARTGRAVHADRARSPRAGAADRLLRGHRRRLGHACSSRTPRSCTPSRTIYPTRPPSSSNPSHARCTPYCASAIAGRDRARIRRRNDGAADDRRAARAASRRPHRRCRQTRQAARARPNAWGPIDVVTSGRRERAVRLLTRSRLHRTGAGRVVARPAASTPRSSAPATPASLDTCLRTTRGTRTSRPGRPPGAVAHRPRARLASRARGRRRVHLRPRGQTDAAHVRHRDRDRARRSISRRSSPPHIPSPATRRPSIMRWTPGGSARSRWCSILPSVKKSSRPPDSSSRSTAGRRRCCSISAKGSGSSGSRPGAASSIRPSRSRRSTPRGGDRAGARGAAQRRSAAREAQAGDALTIGIDDISLPLPPMRTAGRAAAVLERVLTLAAEAGVDDVELVVANSLHRRMTESEIRRMVGERVFRAFWPDRLRNFDAEDPDDVVFLGTTDHGEEVELCKRVDESDLARLREHQPRRDGRRPQIGPRRLRHLPLAPSPPQRRGHCSSRSPTCSPEKSALHHSATRMGKFLADKLDIFTVETTLNNDAFPSPYDFLSKREFEWSLRDQATYLGGHAGLKRMPEGIRQQACSTRSKRRTRSPSVQAGETEAVHAKTLEHLHKQQVVPVEGQADVLTVGIPYVGPYNVNSIMNPILVVCMSLGYFFNLYRNAPLVRPGGVMIVAHPTRARVPSGPSPELHRLLRRRAGRHDRPEDDRGEVREAVRGGRVVPAPVPHVVRVPRRPSVLHVVLGGARDGLPRRRDLPRRRPGGRPTSRVPHGVDDARRARDGVRDGRTPTRRSRICTARRCSFPRSRREADGDLS